LSQQQNAPHAAAALASETQDNDGQRVRSASIRVGVTVGLASAVIVTLIASLTFLFIFSKSHADPRTDSQPRPGRFPPPHGGPEWRTRVVSIGDIVPVIVLLTVIGVVLLGLIAWYSARQSTKSLAEALRIQRSFVADASHELRTPLTVLDSRIQLTKHRFDRGADIRADLDQLRSDAGVMNQVLEDLLLSTEMSGAGLPLSTKVRTVCLVDAAMENAISQVKFAAEAADVSLIYHGLPGVGVVISKAALGRALVILLDNAIGHSPGGQSVEVFVETSPDMTQIHVQDHGSGIKGVSPDHVFDRFARGETQRRGFGIGLALVKEIAGRFGGDVWVKSTSPNGTTFVLNLIRARTS
jgi:Signal transduction histidine kinase